MLDTRRFSNFDIAVHESLEFLRQCSEFDLWMVTQVDGEDWTVLCVSDKSYGVDAGTIFRWADSFCIHMVAGKGPNVAPDAQLVSVYRNAPFGQQVAIGAYIGFPIYRTEGRLFGTLCAIHPTSKPETIDVEAKCAEIVATLLGVVLSTEDSAIQQARTAEWAKTAALCDALTSLYNRRGWNQMLSQAEAHCQQYGYGACVIVIDLDGMKQINDTQGHAKGDDVLRQTGRAIQAAVRQRDVVARIGGDEFAVLCVECDRVTGMLLSKRITRSLQRSGIAASLGIAARHQNQPLSAVWDKADQAMYACKKQHKREQL